MVLDCPRDWFRGFKDGTPRDPDDTTKSFADLARNSGFNVDQIGILQANQVPGQGRLRGMAE